MKSLTLILGLATLSTPALAAPVSFTGAEFANLSGITFPTGTQTIIGNSLRIDATNTNSVIASLPLDQFNADVSNFEVQIDITRLFDDNRSADQDLTIYLSDGRNLFGAQFFDATSTDVRGRVRRDELNSDGQSLISREFFDQSSAVPTAINNSYLATTSVQATATNTIIAGDINNGAVSFTETVSTLFDPSNGGPSLVLISNASIENYQINSVTFTRGVSAPTAVAEPGMLGGMALSLAALGFGLYRRRFG